MTEGKRFIVLRNTHPQLEGRWYEINPGPVVKDPDMPPGCSSTTFEPNGQFERRDDGMSARVYVPVPIIKSEV